MSDERTTPTDQTPDDTGGDEADDKALRTAEDVLAAFNADEVIERPGELDEPLSPASDTDTPPPG